MISSYQFQAAWKCLLGKPYTPVAGTRIRVSVVKHWSAVSSFIVHLDISCSGNDLSSLGPELSRQLEYWLHQADLIHGPARAIIAPWVEKKNFFNKYFWMVFRHAGYQYCGACGGHAYRQVSPVVVRRVFILGPSHHVRLSGCALSTARKYKTPLYDLHVDSQGNLTPFSPIFTTISPN